MAKPRIAVLDDYQDVALKLADWSKVQQRAEVTVFRDHLVAQDEVIERLKPFNIVCVMRERTPLPRTILEQLPNLKLIVTTAMKNVSIDIAAAHERGITVCGTRSTSHGTVELTWGLILTLVRKLPEEIASVRAGGWQTTLAGDLEGRTLGVVGLGKIGQRVAKVANAFGMRVIAWSQNMTAEAAREHGAELVSKEQLFRESDIVTVHLILSDRSRGIVDTPELAAMKPSAYLVNTSRAGLIEQTALLEILRSKRIAGAALDVYDVEPLPADHPFRSTEGLIATPHVGFVEEDGYRIFFQDVVEDLVAWLDGSPVRVLGWSK